MSIFNKTVSAGNLFNGAIDQYSRRIAIGSQHFQRTLPTFFSFFIPEVFGKNRHQIKSSDSSSIDVHAAASKQGIGLSITTELTIIPFARSLN